MVFVEYFPRIHQLQSATKSKSSNKNERRQPEDFTGRIIFMSMFNDISWIKDNEQECELSAKLVSIYSKRFSRKMVMLRTCIRKVALLVTANRKENGTESLN